MNRRQVLGVVCGVTGGFAGCLATGPNEPTTDSPIVTPPPTPPATPSSTPPVDTGGLDEFDPAGTYEHVEVGSREGVDDDFQPHDLCIWNATQDQRSIELRILDRVADTSVHRAVYTIPSDQELEIRLLEPSRYFVQLWGAAIATETLLVPCDMFDCNSSSTLIRVLEDGRIRATIMSTLAACPSFEC